MSLMQLLPKPQASYTDDSSIFFEDKEISGCIKTISYNLAKDGNINGKWEKPGTVAQLMRAIKSVEKGKLEIVSEAEWKNLSGAE